MVKEVAQWFRMAHGKRFPLVVNRGDMRWPCMLQSRHSGSLRTAMHQACNPKSLGVLGSFLPWLPCLFPASCDSGGQSILLLHVLGWNNWHGQLALSQWGVLHICWNDRCSWKVASKKVSIIQRLYIQKRVTFQLRACEFIPAMYSVPLHDQPFGYLQPLTSYLAISCILAQLACSKLGTLQRSSWAGVPGRYTWMVRPFHRTLLV